jgi:hypothetical protein
MRSTPCSRARNRPPWRLVRIREAEDRHAEKAMARSAELFGANYPKAVADVVDPE